MGKYQKKGQVDLYQKVPEKKTKSFLDWIGDIAFGFFLILIAIEGLKWLFS